MACFFANLAEDVAGTTDAETGTQEAARWRFAQAQHSQSTTTRHSAPDPSIRYNHPSVATLSATPHPDLVESSGQPTAGEVSTKVSGARDNAAGSVSRQRARRYCVLLLLLPLIGIPASIALGRSDFFLHHGASVWVRSDDAVFDMHDRRCDVVVFGDSTAMTGINPQVIEQQTGLRTCNIAVTNAVMAVTGNMTLDHFLEHNGRPRMILLQLSPDDFLSQNHSWHNTIYAEGMLELLRHGAPGEARRVLLAHPQEAITFAGYAAGFTAYYGLKQIWFHLTGSRAEEDTIVVRNGFFTPPSPARSFCDPAPTLATSTGDAFPRSLVQAFRQRYAGETDRVLVNVAPIPSCDQNLSAFAAQLDGVTNNTLLPLPIGLFNDQRHYTAPGSTLVSRLIADELNEAAGQPRGAEQTAHVARATPGGRAQ